MSLFRRLFKKPEPTKITNVIDLCEIIANADWRPFTKSDYHTWAGVSKEGPHFCAYGKHYMLVRDGNRVAAHPTKSFEESTDEGVLILTMETL